jgi:hypothetical protein
MRRFAVVAALACLAVFAVGGIAGASTPGADARLTNDCHPDPGCGAGYVSSYTLATGVPYTDPTLDECTISKGRENEPSVGVDPRNTSVLVGSSNDYCGVYNQGAAAGAVGPIWLGYYRSQDSGSSWVSSLVPGYPGDSSPYAALSQARTAGSGDPVIAWDNHGRAFFGSESSADLLTPKTWGDVWVARYVNPDGPDAANSARQIQRQDVHLGRPHRRRLRRQRLLLVVALHRQRRRGGLLRPLDRPRRHVLEPDEGVGFDPRRPVPGHLGHG